MSHSDSSQSESENVDTTYVDQCYSTDKRCKMDNKPDRLSALPDHLLRHILSSFQMKDVIRTGVLSKRLLSLWYAKLGSEVVDAICSGCPGLESLKFCMCFGVLGFHINSKSMKKLVIGGYWYQENKNSDDEYKELTICARNITSLEINGSFHKKLLVLQNVQALVNAKLYSFDFRTSQKMLSDLLASLSNVEKLFIGP
ncbi:hypothetical protein FXO38_03019 [Capsicum annuum]|uniref:F-box domain-containing protein n=1 Tax=Capsicum annuum TaxID=4072 RepID=A0A2G3A8Y1_CAPAN|nr:hypothetical protein FXO38_03019 [Capsicum annuum]PHT90702.1 hypothetical protein T459_05815 [Capsicum annuum]